MLIHATTLRKAEIKAQREAFVMLFFGSQDIAVLETQLPLDFSYM